MSRMIYVLDRVIFLGFIAGAVVIGYRIGRYSKDLEKQFDNFSKSVNEAKEKVDAAKKAYEEEMKEKKGEVVNMNGETI